MPPRGILLTRLRPPRLPPHHLHRDELVQRLVAGLEAGSVVVVAGAGYGKTTLLAEALAGLSTPGAWCSCDERLTGPELLAHMSAALGECFPGFGSRLDLEGDATDQIEALCNEVVIAAPDDLVVVLDDVHALTPSAQDALAGLVRDLPGNVHLALASRPPLPAWLSGRASVQGLVLRSADLALTEGETSELLGRRPRPAMQEAAALHEITEGWITGVILGSQAGERLQQVTRGLDDSGLFDYLADEVLAAQPGTTRRFLLETSILDRFSPEVASSVTGHADAAVLCQELVAEHVFTERLDGEGNWYRYHHLFRAFLRSRLDEWGPSATAALHRRAAAAYRAFGQVPEAVHHLLEAGDQEAAAELLEPVAQAMLDTPEMETLGGWLESIPVDLRADRPGLVLAHAGLLVERVEFERAFAAAEDAARQLIGRGEHARAAVVLTRLIMAMISAGAPHQEGLDTVERFLPMIDPETPTRPALLVALASRYGHACRYDEGRGLVAEALGGPGGMGNRELEIFAASVAALFLDHPQGRSAAALDRLSDVVAATRSARSPSAQALGTYAAAFRPLILNDLNRFEEALIEADALEMVSPHWYARRARRVLAWVRVAALAGLGRWGEVERLLPHARATVEGIGLSTYRYRYESVAARLAAAKGDTGEAQELIAKTREQLERMGYAFQRALILADLGLAAWTIGLGDLALAMAREADAAAEAARSPLARLRAGAALSLTLRDGSERDGRIASTLELSSRDGLASLWAAGDPATLAPVLAHALRAGLGPPGATRQVITARADPLLSACAPLLIGAPPAARAELAAAAGEATSGDPAVVEGLLRDPDESVRRAARAGRRRLRAARPPLRLGGLGGFSAARGDVPIPAAAFGSLGARRLLAALLCAGGPVPRPQATDWLWPDAEPERARRRLSDAVRGLRRALEPEIEDAPEESVVVVTDAGLSLALRADDDWDVVRFLDAAHEALARESGAGRTAGLAEAERAYRGPLYPEWPDAAWSEERRRELVGALGQVLEALADELAFAGEVWAAVTRCERLVALQPDREPHHRRLMRAYAAAGDRPSALRQYHACRVVLRQSFDAQPSTQTRALYADLLAGRDPGAAEEYRDEEPDGVVTIMFTDIEGSTPLAERLGDDRWMDVLRGHDAIVRAQVRAHGGREVKAQGDGFMLAFPSAGSGVACAIALQRAFALDGAESPDERLAVRVGLHCGEAVREGDDLFGRSVMVAARIAANAEGGQIAVSDAVRDQLVGAVGSRRLDRGREIPLKGLAGRHRIHLVDWEVREPSVTSSPAPFPRLTRGGAPPAG